MSDAQNATQETTGEAAAADVGKSCTGCGACSGERVNDAVNADQGEGNPEGMQEGLTALLRGIGGMAVLGRVMASKREAQEDDGSKIEMATLEEARAYLELVKYKPQPMDVVRLNSNGKEFTDLPEGAQTAVVARVLETPAYSKNACHHETYGRNVADCTLLVAYTNEEGVKAFTEVLFNSVYLELAS